MQHTAMKGMGVSLKYLALDFDSEQTSSSASLAALVALCEGCYDMIGCYDTIVNFGRQFSPPKPNMYM